MKSKTLALFVVVTVILAGVAVFTSQKQGEESTESASKPFFPELAKNLERIDQVDITTGNQTIAFARQQGNWVVKSKDDYSADPIKLREMLLALTSMRTVEAKSKKPENYEKLGVWEPGEGRSSHSVSIKDEKGAVLAGLIAGKAKPVSGPNSEAQMYVRKAGDEQAWLVTGQLNFPADALAWVDHAIGDINGSRIKSVGITPASGKGITLIKEKHGDAAFNIKDLPKGFEFQDPNSPNTLASALENMQLEDVLPVGKIEFAKGKTAQAVFETFDGVVITAALTEVDGKHYVKYVAVGVPVAAPSVESNTKPAEAKATSTVAAPAPTATAPAASTTPKTALVPPLDPKIEAQDLNTRWEKWVFVIPAYKATALTQGLEAYKKKS